MPKGTLVRYRALAALLASAVLAAAIGVVRGGSDAVAQTAGQARRADGVSALGRLEPEHGVIRIGIPSTPEAVSGAKISKLLVEAGDDVTEGQLLAELETAALEQATVEVMEAEVAYAQRQAEVAVGLAQDACSRADVAKNTSTRRAELVRKGLTSKEEADLAAGDAQARSGSCSSAQVATNAAKASVQLAQARLNRARIALERTRVRAPFAGRVLEILKRPGELVMSEGILELGRVDRMYAIAEIYETDVRRVRVGQKATVTSSALPGPISGVVKYVRQKVRKQDATGTDPAASKDARIVEVEVLLDDPKPVAALTYLQVEVVIRP